MSIFISIHVRAWEIIPQDSDADRMPIGNCTGYWVWPHKIWLPSSLSSFGPAYPGGVKMRCQFSVFTSLHSLHTHLAWSQLLFSNTLLLFLASEKGEWKLKGQVFVMLVPKANFRLITSITKSLWRALKFLNEAQVWREVDWHSRVWPCSAVNTASTFHHSSH